MMKLSFNLAEDDELRKTLTQFAEGVFKTLIREEIKTLIREEIARKMAGITAEAISKMTQEAIGQRLDGSLKYSPWATTIKNLVDESAAKAVERVVEKQRSFSRDLNDILDKRIREVIAENF